MAVQSGKRVEVRTVILCQSIILYLIQADLLLSTVVNHHSTTILGNMCHFSNDRTSKSKKIPAADRRISPVRRPAINNIHNP